MKTRPCEHNQFSASVEVARLSEEEGGPIGNFVADVRIRCEECGAPFKFMGVQCGISMDQPMASVDREELRAPIKPSTRPCN